MEALDLVYDLIRKGLDPETAAASEGFEESELDPARVRKLQAQFDADIARTLYEGMIVKGSVTAAAYLHRARKKPVPNQLEISFAEPAKIELPDNGRLRDSG